MQDDETQEMASVMNQHFNTRNPYISVMNKGRTQENEDEYQFDGAQEILFASQPAACNT